MTDSSVELKELNPDIDPRLMETPLPNVLALQKGLRGDELSNPEIYLREFLNASHYFRQLSNGDEYKKPDKENNGENDAISSSYEIDFKLLISNSMGEGKRNTSLQKIEYRPGMVAAVPPKSKKQYYEVTYIAKLLRGYAAEDLEKRNYTKEHEVEVRDLDNFVKVLQTNKNILFFMPSTFSYFDKTLSRDEKVCILTNALEHDMLESFSYRQKHENDKDTFLSTILDDDFIVWKHENNRLVVKDVIPLKKSKTFMHLADFA